MKTWAIHLYRLLDYSGLLPCQSFLLLLLLLPLFPQLCRDMNHLA